MSARIRTSTVIMSWNSRRRNSQREPGESPLIFFAGIFLTPIQNRPFPLWATTDDERSGRDIPRVWLSSGVRDFPLISISISGIVSSNS